MSRLGKLAMLLKPEEVRDWIASAVQNGAAKENAGLVEISRFDPARDGQYHYGFTVKTNGGHMEHTVWIHSARVTKTGNAREHRAS